MAVAQIMAEGNLHIVTGGAGFVSRTLIKRLLAAGDSVAAMDNLRRGAMRNIEEFSGNPRFAFARVDASDHDALDKAFGAALRGKTGNEVLVWHMAANSDILAGVNDPEIDLRDTYMTTHCTLRVMRNYGLRRIAFASSSAVYGPLDTKLHEDIGPLFPISNYGAMKLASEGAISAAVEGYLERASIFRFPNVVGAFATHGVIYDFARKLRHNPAELEVLGDGEQQKSYLLVDELVDAMLFIEKNAMQELSYFNIGPPDVGVTVRFIAEETIRVASPAAHIRYTGGDRGWVGDVPKFNYSTQKLAALGWTPRLSSADAIRAAIPLIWRESE